MRTVFYVEAFDLNNPNQGWRAVLHGDGHHFVVGHLSREVRAAAPPLFMAEEIDGALADFHLGNDNWRFRKAEWRKRS